MLAGRCDPVPGRNAASLEDRVEVATWSEAAFPPSPRRCTARPLDAGVRLTCRLRAGETVPAGVTGRECVGQPTKDSLAFGADHAPRLGRIGLGLSESVRKLYGAQDRWIPAHRGGIARDEAGSLVVASSGLPWGFGGADVLFQCLSLMVPLGTSTSRMSSKHAAAEGSTEPRLAFSRLPIEL